MPKFIINAPVKGYTGSGYGLTFVNGVAETDNEYLAKRLGGKGYSIEGLGAAEVAEETEEKAIRKMTVAQLEEYAASHDIDLSQAKNKDEKLALVLASIPPEPNQQLSNTQE